MSSRQVVTQLLRRVRSLIASRNRKPESQSPPGLATSLVMMCLPALLILVLSNCTWKTTPSISPLRAVSLFQEELADIDASIDGQPPRSEIEEEAFAGASSTAFIALSQYLFAADAGHATSAQAAAVAAAIDYMAAFARRPIDRHLLGDFGEARWILEQTVYDNQQGLCAAHALRQEMAVSESYVTRAESSLPLRTAQRLDEVRAKAFAALENLETNGERNLPPQQDIQAALRASNAYAEEVVAVWPGLLTLMKLESNGEMARAACEQPSGVSSW